MRGTLDDRGLSVVAVDPTVRLLYQRFIAGWAQDTLNGQRRISVANTAVDDDDYRDRDWRKLYRGDVLDD